MKRQRGYLLLELLIAVMILMVLAAIAVPNLMQMKLSAEQVDATNRVKAMWLLETTYATCMVVNNGQCQQVDHAAPKAISTITVGDYTYTFTPSNGYWTYTATPNIRGLKTISTDQTGQVWIN